MCVNNLPKVQGCYLEAERPGVEPRLFESRVQRHNHYTTQRVTSIRITHHSTSHQLKCKCTASSACLQLLLDFQSKLSFIGPRDLKSETLYAAVRKSGCGQCTFNLSNVCFTAELVTALRLFYGVEMLNDFLS